MELAERVARIAAAEPLPQIEQQLDELPVARELGPVAADGALVVDPEGARVAWAPSRSPGRVVELAHAKFHAPSVAALDRAAISVCAVFGAAYYRAGIQSP
jgi:hypothetical protein